MTTFMTFIQAHPKTKILRYRRKVPADLQAAMGRIEILESLGTRNRSEASRLYGDVHTRWEDRLADARTGGSPALFEEWADRFHDEPFDRMLKLSSRDEAAEVVRVFVREHETPFGTAEKIDRFIRVCLRGHRQHRPEGFGFVPIDYVKPVPIIEAPREIPAASPNNLPLSVILGKYLADPEQREMKSAGEWRMIFRRFEEIVGGDLPVRSITPDHVIEFKATVAQIPSNVRGKSWVGLTVPQIIARAKGKNLKLLSVASIGKHIGAIGSVLMWAKVNRHCDHDPTQGLKVKGSGSRRPYTTDELNKIFADPIYATKPVYRDAKYWIPILGLFTGCRLEEIAQATVKDVRREGDVWVLDVNNFDDKSLKNSGSRRLMPLHRVVIDLGFIAYRNAVEKRGEKRLFPDVDSKKRQTSAQFSKWWAAHTDRLGLTDPETVFHSFRHNFADAATEAEISERVKDTLMGHAGGGTGRNKYGNLRKTVPLRQLAAGMAAITYPGVRLPK